MDVAVLIVNSIASLVAIIALVITCCQFRKNMQEQNRAINVSLFDMRTDVLANIENGKFDFDRVRAKMLFDSSIADSIAKYDLAKGQERRYKGLKEEFLGVIRSQLADDTYEEATDLLRQIDDYSRMDPEDPTYEQVRGLLRNHTLTGKWLHGADPCEYETVNYIDAEDTEVKCHFESEEIRKALVKSVKSFIETSIK